MISLYNRYKESGLTSGELHKERQTHEAKTELEIVKGAVKNLKSMQAKIAKMELSLLEGEGKTTLIGEIDRLNRKLTDRLNDLIQRLDLR